ncbi:EIF4B [Mytilus edulis]|uniref:EIF4B n=1 Tax=Mytilus edulis TaxID=6550 RepID=A0A8S3UMF0_MYTED|nr:EIF4B [Mytilus edulis]
MGCVYIPPEGSKYSSVDAFTEIENEFLHLSEPNLKNVLIGDFNAKTSTLLDYVIPDQLLLEILNTDDTHTMQYFSDYNGLLTNNISLQRYSKCACRPNTYGHRLLELYVHCNLKFTLESQPYANINNVKTVEKQVIKWNNNKQDKFVKFVKEKKSEGIRDIETILDKLIDRNDTVQQTDIDTAMNKICEIFNSSSISVFGTKCKNQKYAKHNEKPWYKRGCKSKRNLFHQARQRYGNLKSKENKKALKEASKSYKKELNRSYNDFQMNTAKDLRKLAKSDPKRLWQKLNSININKSNKTDAVKIEDLYEHFKRLSQDEVIEDNSDIDLTKMVDGDLSVAVITVTIDMEAETPAERPRLNLKPRTKAPEDAPTTDKPPARKPSANIFGDAKPVDIVAKEKEKERAAPMSDKPPARKPSANIFGDAKPVDTAAKEREIEERLRRGREDESRRKADEEKENTNSTSPGYRPRQYSGEEGGGRQRRLSSNSSGKGRPGPPPVTSPGKPRRDSDVSNHSQEVFSGGEETKEEPRSPVSPAHRDEAASKLVPAPPPPVNIWEKRKETVVKTAVVSVKSPMESHTHIKSETRSIADAPSSSSSSSSTSQSPENKAAPPPKDNPWTRRQYNKESDEPVSSSPMGKPSGRGERSGSRGRGRGHGGYPDKGRGQESKPRHEKKIPQSIDEMPKYEPQVQKDFRQKNKFAGLLDDEDEDNGEDST